MLSDKDILSDEQIAEIEALSAKVPDGPWFADADIADDVPEHRRSGLALVDTRTQWQLVDSASLRMAHGKLYRRLKNRR